MKRLAVCAFPGDEITLFSNAILSEGEDWSAILGSSDEIDGATPMEAFEQWRRACSDLGVRAVACLFLPRIDNGYTADRLRELVRPFASAYDEIFVPNVEDDSPLRRALSIALAQERDRVVMESAFGEHVCTIDNAGFDLLVRVLNKHHASRMRVKRIDLRDLRGTRHYRVINGGDLARFAREFLSWDLADVNPRNPWDLAESEYERARYALELDVLQRLAWTSLTEVGACIGIFTEQLANRFSERTIRAYEPSEMLHAELAKRVGHRVEVVRGGADDLCGRSDLLFVSSVLYYLDHFPSRILDLPERWLVLSHLRSYHDETITPILRSAGWVCVSRDELPPRIEHFCTFPVLKDGTEVAVWERP
jgi:hypothetical protein